jgi:hypothetical protein
MSLIINTVISINYLQIFKETVEFFFNRMFKELGTKQLDLHQLLLS